MTPIIPPFANSKMPPTKFVVPCTNEILLPPFEIEILLQRERERERSPLKLD